MVFSHIQWHFLSFLEFTFNDTNVHVCVRYVPKWAMARRGRKRAPVFLDLELQRVVNYLRWVLGDKIWSFGREASILNHWTTSPAHPQYFQWKNRNVGYKVGGSERAFFETGSGCCSGSAFPRRLHLCCFHAKVTLKYEKMRSSCFGLSYRFCRTELLAEASESWPNQTELITAHVGSAPELAMGCFLYRAAKCQALRGLSSSDALESRKWSPSLSLIGVLLLLDPSGTTARHYP